MRRRTRTVRRPPRDLVDVVGGDRTSDGLSRPERTFEEVFNAPDGSARRGITPPKSFFLRELVAWDCPVCDRELASHWARCPECRTPRPRPEVVAL